MKLRLALLTAIRLAPLAALQAADFKLTPTAEAPFAHADSKYQVDTDFKGAKRNKPLSGARTK